MSQTVFKIPFRAMLLLIAVAAFAGISRGADVKADATLTESTMQVGDANELTIEVSGVGQLRPPGNIDVPGLNVRYRSNEQSVKFDGRRAVSTIRLTYIVEAEKEGKYTIPAIEMDSDEGVLRTQPIELVVQAAASGGNSQSGTDRNANYFGEITVPKTTLYLGETIPVEIRLYLDARIRGNLSDPPDFSGEGFTKQKFGKIRQEEARKDGRQFTVVVFRTAITPGRAGKLTIGPCDIPFEASIPRAKPRRGRDILDEDLFDPFGMFTPAQRFTAKAPAVELDVKPLPAAGKPASFTGAIGQFRFSANGSPNKVKVGDPITMKMEINGRGNFDRVNVPVLADNAGWHSYPPNSDFKAKDELGLQGNKTFEMAVVPEENKDAMPVCEFTYFDPDAEKYVTLKSDPQPLTVEGAPALPPPVTSSNKTADQPATPAPTVAVPKDILGLKYEPGPLVRTFDPLYRQRGFLLLQLVPAAACLIFAGSRLLRKDASAERQTRLRRERVELWKKLQSTSAHAEFYQSAARIVQIGTALATGGEDASVDAVSARTARPMDEDTAKGINEIFEARAALLYAGTARSDGRVAEPERERVLTTLQRFEKGHA